jgi:hypothetical protein
MAIVELCYGFEFQGPAPQVANEYRHPTKERGNPQFHSPDDGIGADGDPIK